MENLANLCDSKPPSIMIRFQDIGFFRFHIYTFILYIYIFKRMKKPTKLVFKLKILHTIFKLKRKTTTTQKHSVCFIYLFKFKAKKAKNKKRKGRNPTPKCHFLQVFNVWTGTNKWVF